MTHLPGFLPTPGVAARTSHGRKCCEMPGKPEGRKRHQPQQEASHSVTAALSGLWKNSALQTVYRLVPRI
jgi:hypothetical protein